MTDKELLEMFLAKLGLKQVENSIGIDIGRHEYVKILDERGCSIRIGCGIGYGGFVAEFYFDENGKAVNHGVWE